MKLLEGGRGEAAAEEAAIVERLEAGGRSVLTLLDMVGIVGIKAMVDIVDMGIVEVEEEGSPM